MGQGSYVICEQDSIQKENSVFQAALKSLEMEMIQKCNVEWAHMNPNAMWVPSQPFGGSGHWGRTTILPALFDDHSDAQMGGHWRQLFTTTGHQTLITGTRAGNVVPEDFKIAWAGLAFPNKNQHLTEVRWQIGDRKFGRINIEEINLYNKPALVFEEGFIIDEEQSFDLYGYIEGPIPTDNSGLAGVYQYIVMLGFCTYKAIDRVLGDCGAVI